MLVVIVPVVVARMDRFNVSTESHPTELVNVSKYVPADDKLTALNKYDCPAQMLVVMVPVEVARMDKLNVTIESHPTELVNVSR